MTKYRQWLLAPLLAAAGLSLAHAAEAPPPRWSNMVETLFDRFGADIGLPNAAVTGIAQDRAGFLWLATQSGLGRFDGYRVHTFSHDPNSPGSLPDNVLNKIIIDHDDDVWVGSLTAGLARYDRRHNRFEHFKAGPQGISNNGVAALLDTPAGLWIGTNGGLDLLPRGNDTFQHFHPQPDRPGSLPSDVITGLALDQSGALWVSSNGGLVKRGANGDFAPPRADSARSASALQSPVSAVLCDSQGRLWFTLDSGELGVVDPATGLARLLRLHGAGASTLASARVTGMIEAAPGMLWAGTMGRGVVAIDTRTGLVRNLRNNPRTQFSLPDDFARGLARDRQGLVWVGTQRGLARHNPAMSSVQTLFGATRERSLSNGEALGVLVTRNGRVWVSHASGIDILDPHEGLIGQLPSTPKGAERAVPDQLSYGMAEAPDGSVFVGTLHGLYRANPASFAVQRIPLLPEDPFCRVNTVVLDGQQLWVGTHHHGLLSLHLNGSTPQAHSVRSYPGLSDSRVEVVLPGRDGLVWIGTFSGLNRLDPVTGHIEQFLPDSKNPTSLSAGLVASLRLDRHDRLWVATYGGGVNLLEKFDDAGKAVFRRFGQAQGLPSDMASVLLGDAQDRIWASTTEGLAIIDSNSLAMRTVGHEDGIRIRGSWPNSGAATAQGELLFGGQGGITIAHPDSLAARPIHGQLAITAVQAGAQALSIDAFNRRSDAQHLRLDGSGTGFQIDFALLDYRNPQHHHYQYRLEGFDPDWVNTSASRRVAAYTNLAPGHYQLRLRGSSDGRHWIEREQPLQVEVLPAWYQTWWARTLALLASLALVGAALWKRTTYLRLRQHRLERQVAQRTSALSDSLEQLRRTQSRLVQQEKLASLGQLVAGVAHEINTPVGVAIGAASQLKNETAALQRMAEAGKMKRSDFEHYLQLTGELASMVLVNSQRAGTLISSFKQVAADRTSDIRRTINLMDYIQEVLWSLDPLIKRSEVQVRLEGSATVQLVTYPGLLAQVLTNFVQNALTHAFSGVAKPQIRIEVEAGDGELARFSFSDNGIGMAPEVCQRIFDPFFTTRRNDGGTGLGLHLVYNLVTSPLGGEITVSSQPGQGTCFRVGLQNFQT